jgi:hypothetical protein
MWGRGNDAKADQSRSMRDQIVSGNMKRLPVKRDLVVVVIHD